MLHAICSDPTLEFRSDQINESEAVEASLNEINAAADVRCRERLLLHRMNGWMHSYAGLLLHQFLRTFDQASVLISWKNMSTQVCQADLLHRCPYDHLIL